jgi:ferric-dicitrate binding protein FerR (iron transport regulator)
MDRGPSTEGNNLLMMRSIFFAGLLLAVLFLGNLFCKGRGGQPSGESGQVVVGVPQGKDQLGEDLLGGGTTMIGDWQVAANGDRLMENKTGRPGMVGLPDGSRVVINVRTVIRIPGTYNQSRVLDLDGEAMFDILPDAGKPFVVRTRNLEIEVLGTRFRVDAYRSNAGEQVDLLEGRLRVKKSYHSDTDNEPEFIEAGEMVMINRDIDLMEKEKLDSGELSRLKVRR